MTQSPSIQPAILGVGIDLCEVDRIRDLTDRYGDRFLHRAYTDVEIDYIGGGPGAYRRSAAVFAGKEAVVKCLGTGFARGVGWKQVEVMQRDAAWCVELSGEARAVAVSAGPSTWMMAVNTDGDRALAIAIWSKQW